MHGCKKKRLSSAYRLALETLPVLNLRAGDAEPSPSWVKRVYCTTLRFGAYCGLIERWPEKGPACALVMSFALDQATERSVTAEGDQRMYMKRT